MRIILTESQLKLITEELLNTKIRRMTVDDIKVIIPRLAEVFHKTKISNIGVWNMVKTEISIDKSVVILVDNKISGFYFIGDNQIPDIGNDVSKKLGELQGAEGVALGVFPEYKDRGLGKELITWSQYLPVDYIWGYQLKSLDNINDWKKRRDVYLETPSMFITYQIFNDDFTKNNEIEMSEIMNNKIKTPFISEFN